MARPKATQETQNECLRSYLRGIHVAVKDVPAGDVAAAWRTLGRVEFLCERALGIPCSAEKQPDPKGQDDGA